MNEGGGFWIPGASRGLFGIVRCSIRARGLVERTPRALRRRASNRSARDDGTRSAHGRAESEEGGRRGPRRPRRGVLQRRGGVPTQHVAAWRIGSRRERRGRGRFRAQLTGRRRGRGGSGASAILLSRPTARRFARARANANARSRSRPRPPRPIFHFPPGDSTRQVSLRAPGHWANWRGPSASWGRAGSSWSSPVGAPDLAADFGTPL